MAGLIPTGESGVSEAEFEQFWNHYPRRVGKGSARKAFLKARKIASFEEIFLPMQAFFRSTKGTPINKIPHPTTWLNAERWLDEQSHAINHSPTSDDDLQALGAKSPPNELQELYPKDCEQSLLNGVPTDGL